MQHPMTKKQANLKSFIVNHTKANGECPSFAEMLHGLGMVSNSSSQLVRLLRGLEERGHIVRLPGRHRAIKVLEDEK